MFLSEDEVSEEMSALKYTGPVDPALAEDDRLGILNASFKWNEVEEEKEKESDKDKKDGLKTRVLKLFKRKSRSAGVPDSPETDPGDSVSVSGQSSEERKFELRDVNIVFPQGKLTLVTGPSMLFRF